MPGAILRTNWISFTPLTVAIFARIVAPPSPSVKTNNFDKKPTGKKPFARSFA